MTDPRTPIPVPDANTDPHPPAKTNIDPRAPDAPDPHTAPRTRHVVMFSGDDPVIIAIDATASMNSPDAVDGRVRLEYAIDRVGEVIDRLPHTTLVTVLAFDRDVFELARRVTPAQARDALGVIAAGGAVANHGRVIEWCVDDVLEAIQAESDKVHVYDPATLVFVTDGVPDDFHRYSAWLSYALRHEFLAAVHVLHVAPIDDVGAFTARAPEGRRMHVSPLHEDTEIRLSTRTQSDKPEAERIKAPTVPPSISPPKQVHVDRDTERELDAPAPTFVTDPVLDAKVDAARGGTEHVDPKKHAPAARRTPTGKPGK